MSETKSDWLEERKELDERARRRMVPGLVGLPTFFTAEAVSGVRRQTRITLF